jgi:hypothetical protein
MRRLTRLLLGTLAVLLLLGNNNCSTDNNAADSPQAVTSIVIQDGNGNVVSNASTAPIFTAGATIEFSVTIRNRSSVTQTYWFNTSEESNFAVVPADTADVVWNADTGETPTTGFTSFTLTSGQSQTITVTWNQEDDAGDQVAAGNYEVMGGFTVYNTLGAGSAADNSSSMAEGQPTSAQMFPSIYRSILMPFTIQ